MADASNLFPPKRRPWQEIAEDIRNEQDQERIIALVKELNDTMVEDERQKVRHRLDRNPVFSRIRVDLRPTKN